MTCPQAASHYASSSTLCLVCPPFSKLLPAGPSDALESRLGCPSSCRCWIWMENLEISNLKGFFKQGKGVSSRSMWIKKITGIVSCFSGFHNFILISLLLECIGWIECKQNTRKHLVSGVFPSIEHQFRRIIWPLNPSESCTVDISVHKEQFYSFTNQRRSYVTQKKDSV